MSERKSIYYGDWIKKPGVAHGFAEDPRERVHERVDRLGVLRAPEHRLDGVLVALRERTEVDGATVRPRQGSPSSPTAPWSFA